MFPSRRGLLPAVRHLLDVLADHFAALPTRAGLRRGRGRPFSAEGCQGDPRRTKARIRKARKDVAQSSTLAQFVTRNSATQARTLRQLLQTARARGGNGDWLSDGIDESVTQRRPDDRDGARRAGTVVGDDGIWQSAPSALLQSPPRHGVAIRKAVRPDAAPLVNAMPASSDQPQCLPADRSVSAPRERASEGPVRLKPHR